MPFKSKAQQRYMFAAEARGDLPAGTAERWAHHTRSIKRLPEHVHAKTRKKQADHLQRGGQDVSTEAPPQAAPTPAEAYDHIMERVYHPVFFHKLAAAGVVPQSQREAEQLLHIGAQLFAGHQEKLAADAEARGTFLDFAVARLDGARPAGGFSDAQVKQASATMLADEATLAAAATLAEAVAQVA